MGTPDFAVPTLEALVAAGHAVVAAYTQPPRPGGRRGRELVPSPVQRRAEALGIPVRSPTRLRGADEQAAFAALEADVGVVAAYGLILPQPVLDAPRHGCLNVHGSLLPRWRGAAPVQRAILAGDQETGVCIMRMEAGLDTGPVLLDGRVPVGRKTAGELTAELAHLGAALMIETLATFDARVAVPQPEAGVTYAAKIDKAEARIDWNHLGQHIERQVRALDPWPGAFFEFAGERIKVFGPGGWRGQSRGPLPERYSPGTVIGDNLRIQCAANTWYMPSWLQRPGRAVVTVEEFLRGLPIPPGTRL